MSSDYFLSGAKEATLPIKASGRFQYHSIELKSPDQRLKENKEERGKAVAKTGTHPS